MPLRPALDILVLVAALVGEGVVLYVVDSPATRLALGLLVLAPIVWTSSRIGLLELITHTAVERVYKRRFIRLRAQVQQLLDEIRRLNWMAVDAARGFRDRDNAFNEMDIIEKRLKELIQQIRSTAGQISADGEAVRGSDERVAAR